MRLFKNFSLIYQIALFKFVLKITRYVNNYEKTIHVLLCCCFCFCGFFYLLFQWGIDNSNFYKNKILFKIDDIDVNKILVSKKEPYSKKELT